MKKLLRLLLPALLLAANVQAQNEPGGATGVGASTERPSAGHGSPGLNGLFNVNQYDGTASINIPLHSYSINGLNLGVSISYDTHGLKVDERESNIGMGWSLNLGGSIQREIKELEDEVTITNPPNVNFPNRPTPVYTGCWFDERGRVGNDAVAGDVKEKQQDLFHASFAGRSVSFEMKINEYNGVECKTNPVSGLSIRPFFDNCEFTSPAGQRVGPIHELWHLIDKSPTKNILGFQIRDEKGNVFIFTRGNYNTKVVNAACTYYPATSWNLSEVITKDNQHVKYTYAALDVDYIESHEESVTEVNEAVPEWGVAAGITVNENKDVNFKGQTTFIERIEYPNGVVLDFFYKEDQWPMEPLRPLDKLVISSKYDNNVKNQKTYRFNYAFYHSPWKTYTATEVPYTSSQGRLNYYAGPDDAEKIKQAKHGWRLKLKGIDIIGNDNLTVEPYFSFEYNNNPLPQRFSPSKDYYGYYNGKMPVSSHSSLAGLTVPLHTNTVFNATYGTDKSSAFSYARSGILEQMKNGTGGAVQFTYKEHVLSNPAAGYKGCLTPSTKPHPDYEFSDANDGLCIDMVVVSDGYSEDNTVKTQYVFSGGQRFFRGGLSWVPWGVSKGTKGRTYYNSCVIPMQFINGSNHGYSYCEVKNFNAAGTFMGSTKMHFTNLILESNTNQSNLKMETDSIYNFYPIDYFFTYRMGKPLDMTDYDPMGNIKSQVAYEYRDDFNPVLNGTVYRSYDNEYRAPEQVRYNNFFCFPFLVKKKTETSTTDNGAFVKAQDYTYNDHFELQTVSWLDDNGNLNTKKFKYTYNSPHPLNPKGIWLPLFTELERTVNNSTYLVDRTEEIWNENPNQVNNYKYGGNKRFCYNSLYNNSNNNAQDYQIRSAKYVAWDGKGNTTQAEDEEDEKSVAYIWDTRVGQNIATANNATFEQIAYTSFEGGYEPFGTADDNKGNWDFNPSSIVYVSPSSSGQPMTGHYYYDLGNQNDIISKYPLASGAKFQLTFWATAPPDISGTSNLQLNEQLVIGSWKLYTAEIIGSGQQLAISRPSGGSIHIDELRLHPFDADMTTTTYEPLFGANSVCDARCNIQYMEYDAMGRQTITRDINRNILKVNRTVVAGNDNY
ncbi:hypothetical protein [Pedobacter frigoris]|uniref:hypothetical protein n=1 Tax=Pedobacter frigoris TaxID=2571272 RepID=UPI00292EA5E2|nr:hypothetical protein [Pedobacter frigoris]